MNNYTISLASILTAKNEFIKSTSSSDRINYNEMIASSDSYKIIDDAGFYIKLRAVYDDVVYESSENEVGYVTLKMIDHIENNQLIIHDSFDPKISVKKLKKLLTPSHITNQSIGFSSEGKKSISAPPVKEFLKLLSTHHPKAALYIILGSYATGDIDCCTVQVHTSEELKNQYTFEAELHVSRNIMHLGLEIIYDIQMKPDENCDIYSYSHINGPDISKLVIIVPLIAIIIIVLVVIITNTGNNASKTSEAGIYPVSMYVNFEGEEYQKLFFSEYTFYVDDIPYGNLELGKTSCITLDLKAGEHTVYLKNKKIKSKEHIINVDSYTDKIIFEAKVGFIVPKFQPVS